MTAALKLSIGRLVPMAAVSGFLIFGISCGDPSNVSAAEDSVDSDGSVSCESALLPAARTSEPVGVRFSLNRETALDSHVFVPTELAASGIGYGGGGALLDFNDDGLVDVFLGQRNAEGTEPCLYVNESTDTETRFRIFECFPQLGSIAGARTVDIEDDGEFELLAYSESEVHLLEFRDTVDITRVMSTDDLDGDCAIYAAIEHPSESGAVVVAFGPFDDTDGPREEPDVDSCQPVSVSPDSAGYGVPTPWADTPFAPVTLALGRADIDQDGTLDTAIIVDSFSNPGVRNTVRHPGGFLRGAAGTGSGESDFIPWVAGSNRAWGSFMGGAQVVRANLVYTVLGDWGPPLLRNPNTAKDEAQPLGFDANGEPFPFSWSPIVADFNLDNRDDILLTRGVVFGSSNGASDEADMLLMQTDEGFADMTSGSGLQPHPSAYDDDTNRPHLSRAGVVSDFDRDGRLEVLILPYEGRPLLYEAEEATHCLATVSSPYTSGPNQLYGWSWLDASGTGHPLRMDAAMRLGDSQWLVLPAGDGVVRAPSGARINYSCEPGDRIDVSEPEWASVEEGMLALDACSAGITGAQIVARSLGASSSIDPLLNERNNVTFLIPDVGLRLVINERFSLSCTRVDQCSRN